MTHKLFWTNPYQTKLETRITAVNDQRVICEETIFFPFSGGQESDLGSIGGFEVLQASKLDTTIEYSLPANHTLTINQSVTMAIDWPRRYKLMRLHFAAELVLELFYKKLPGTAKIGAHIGENKARIDFTWPTSISLLLPEVTAEAAAIIQKNLPINSAFSDRHEEKRFWEIAGFAKVACGGTHPKTTGEVGKISLKRKNLGKGKERVEILLVEPNQQTPEAIAKPPFPLP